MIEGDLRQGGGGGMPIVTRRALLIGGLGLLASACTSSRTQGPAAPRTSLSPTPPAFPRLAAVDHGVVLRHGDGPAACDRFGSREAIVFTDGTTYYLHYDGAGPTGWLACLATGSDGGTWTKHGPVLNLGAAGAPDSASASSPWVIEHDGRWFMYYLGTANATEPPGRVPVPPYVTCLAEADHPAGPWTKRYDVVPFRTTPGTYYATTASPGAVIAHNGEFLQYFSGSTQTATGLKRTLGLARTRDLAAPWNVEPAPLLAPDTDVENSSLYYEPADGGWWWLFTNHISEAAPGPHTDAAYAYWSRDPSTWNPADCAIALDTVTCSWSKGVIGMPTVLAMNGRLNLFYDGVQGDSMSHLGRDIGMASLSVPLIPPH